MLTWFLIAFTCSIVSAVVAKNKGRSGAGWFILGLIIGPFALLVALLPPIVSHTAGSGTRKCPFCAEIIKREAIKCRFCGSDIGVSQVESVGSECPTCNYVFTQSYGSEGWWCPNCKRTNK